MKKIMAIFILSLFLMSMTAISVVAENKPDLEVNGMTAICRDKGEVCEFRVIIINLRPVATGPFDVEFKISPDSYTLIDGYTLIQRISNLEAGGQTTSTVKFVPKERGAYIVEVIVDSNNDVAETNEENNRMTVDHGVRSIVAESAPSIPPTNPTTSSTRDRIDLSNYPEIFFDNDKINAILVVGDEAPADDVIAATDIVVSFENRRSIRPTYLASEVNNLKQNIISVGNPCDNPVTAKLTELNDCHGGLKPGQAMITLKEYQGYAHMAVFGYSRMETRKAARALGTIRLNGQKALLEFKEDFTPERISIPEKTEPEPISERYIEKEPQIIESEKDCVGCRKNGACMQFGIRMIEQNKPVYCDIDNTFKPQKENEKSCQNNYECLSNTCQDGTCQSISEKIQSIEKELKEQRTILDKLVGFFKRLFRF